MIKVFCIDIGYSFKTECKKWEGNGTAYPGQALYGINHFKEQGVMPVFEWCEHGYFYGKWYAGLDELIKLTSMLKYRKDYDLIYIPHAYYSRWIVCLKKLRIIKKPVVVCMHNKNNLRGLIKACDCVLTINPNLEKELKRRYSKLNIKYIPLMPEKEVKLETTTVKYDIISIGNTKRDYPLLTKAAGGLPYKCLIVTAQDIGNVPENVTVINDRLDYAECLALYMQSKIIAIPITAEATEGVFGLTSLVDALYTCKPVVVTKTTGLGIQIEKNRLGMEAEAGNTEAMRKAIQQLMQDEELRDKISNNIKKFKERNNMENSAGEICKAFKEIMN